MNRSTDVLFPVFGYEVRVIAARSVERTGAKLGADLSGAVAGFVYPGTKKPKRAWIVLSPDADEATVAHEASHAVRAMLNNAGARTDNEVFAYHLDFLVGRIHKFLKRSKNAAL
jgi:hypothetical protein